MRAYSPDLSPHEGALPAAPGAADLQHIDRPQRPELVVSDIAAAALARNLQ
jgi:hypothetical protein